MTPKSQLMHFTLIIKIFWNSFKNFIVTVIRMQIFTAVICNSILDLCNFVNIQVYRIFEMKQNILNSTEMFFSCLSLEFLLQFPIFCFLRLSATVLTIYISFENWIYWRVVHWIIIEIFNLNDKTNQIYEKIKSIFIVNIL